MYLLYPMYKCKMGTMFSHFAIQVANVDIPLIFSIEVGIGEK
jgi:hypothetical protein